MHMKLHSDTRCQRYMQLISILWCPADFLRRECHTNVDPSIAYDSRIQPLCILSIMKVLQCFWLKTSVWEGLPSLQHAAQKHLNASLCAEPFDPSMSPLPLDVLGLVLSPPFSRAHLLVVPLWLLEDCWTLSLWRNWTTFGNWRSQSRSGKNPSAEGSKVRGAGLNRAPCGDAVNEHRFNAINV